MEQDMDVSWMTHGKDKLGKHGQNGKSSSDPLPATDATDTTSSSQPLESATPSKINGKASSSSPSPAPSPAAQTAPASPSAAKPIPQRPGRTRSQSNESSTSANGPPLQRKGSWFSNISSKFSGSPANPVAPPPNPSSVPESDADADDVTPLPKITPNKNAVLPHASRQTGDAPYTPAPPRSAQPGFLGVFRRLSSSNGTATLGSKASHGLVERKVLNVDKHRERCRVTELSQAKLRRVAFCVDVEIAPPPKYGDEETPCKKPADKTQKRKLTEKSEGLALKDPKALEEQKEGNGVVKATGEVLPKEPEREGTETEQTNAHKKENSTAQCEEPKSEKETSRKKEKKKKSEAERKAKKEQKRKEALEKGAIPMEIHLDSDSSAEDESSPTAASHARFTPTINPGRIYRRCCQLRETDILTKVTLQLPKTTGIRADGIVEKLDLSGYYLSLPDLITLGDFLAVVPVKEVNLADCGLTDEGIRVVLAGLLAVRKSNARQRKSLTRPVDLAPQGGVIETLVLKNNKIGTEGWKHVCLFIHMCRSIKCLDLSSLPFPTPAEQPKTPLNHHQFHLHHHGPNALAPLDMSLLLSKSIGERLAGSELELLNLGSTGLSANQLGAIVDGVLKSGVSRFGLSHNNIDAQGVQHVAKYLGSANCQGIDLGGNDLRDHLETIAGAIHDEEQLWAMSLAGCNLKPASLCKLLPKLVKLPSFKFLDLSHNHELFASEPSAIKLLRRYLPKMDNLKRLHLADVSLSSEQAIALAEILPEVKTLAHIHLLENPDLVALADARTEDMQEESCALYASLLAAVRVSKTLIKIDIDDPTTESGEIMKAMANRIVAFCMRNLQGVPDIRDSTTGESVQKLEKLPDVLRHLVGQDDDDWPVVEMDDGSEPAPDEDYVIGGTGVAKALACVLKNRGDDFRRQSGDFTRELASGTTTPRTRSRTRLPPGKAKDVSKHLLATARKIRIRLQPALVKAKASANEDMNNYYRLLFLDQTIEGMIKRFEDEFPDTRETASKPLPVPDRPDRAPPAVPNLGTSLSSVEADHLHLSDTEDIETELRPPPPARSNSTMSHTSKAFAEEEGRALRAGHKFRRSFLTQEQFNILNSFDTLGNDPSHVRMITGVMDDLMEDDEHIRKRVEEVGPVRAFEEDKDGVWKRLRDKDPQYWDRFLESQEKAQANIKVDPNATRNDPTLHTGVVDEAAIAD
ncbi:Uu.00g098310.m01.CDS01 [Anthostomella pinea]|uniref:Uu.00g098310.m01.CDS01 n=1 Tax=Anthostomella pinea TaxID=933095 RepID=A0AAI8VD94_9PEZI|nr:Uu.00g098310.m01.CDS01 [Anthostomella pinea]